MRETEVLVYAVGIDGNGAADDHDRGRRPPVGGGPPMPIPFPLPGGGGRGGGGYRRSRGGGGGGGHTRRRPDDRVNVVALREMTDDSGGRTEIVRDPRDLDPATASIADELSKQVLHRLSEPRPQGRPVAHHPRRAARSAYLVRARKGYVATP